MAKIGLRKALYCPLTITETNGVVTEALGTGATIGKSINADIQVKVSEAKLYADDGLAESAKEFVSGTFSFETSDLEDIKLAALCGHVITSGEMVSNGDDVAPYVRVGIIIPKMVNNTVKYRAVCLMKVKFGIPGEKATTKGETITFNTDTIVGDIFKNKDGNWKREKTVTTEALAVTYLNGLLGIT